MKIFILLSMVFLGIVDDFYLQGILGNLKQKKWWDEHHPEKLYKEDWWIAMYLHSFSWTFLMMLPAIIFTLINNGDSEVWILLFLGNIVVHALIDHLKANCLAISLTTDQMCHIIQTAVTWGCLVIWKL